MADVASTGSASPQQQHSAPASGDAVVASGGSPTSSNAGPAAPPVPTAQQMRESWGAVQSHGTAAVGHAAHVVSPECAAKYASLQDETAALRRRLEAARGKLADMDKIVSRFGSVHDPVVASDGFTYDRSQINAYVQECRTRGMPAVSHQNQQELRDTFIPNLSLSRLVDSLRPVVTLPAELAAGVPSARPASAAPAAPVGLN